ncbi:MAG: nucleotidyltransferase domain-containing protein [Sulfolobales archaeon]
MEGRLRLLSMWRSIVVRAARAIKRAYPDAEIYVFGGAAEDRLTIMSDIDLAVVLENPPGDSSELLANIWGLLEEEGIPLYYPLEVHILSRRDFERLKGSKVKLT